MERGLHRKLANSPPIKLRTQDQQTGVLGCDEQDAIVNIVSQTKRSMCLAIHD